MVTPFLTAKKILWINAKAPNLEIPGPFTTRRSDCRVSVA